MSICTAIRRRKAMTTAGRIIEHSGTRLVIECEDDLEREIAQKKIQTVEMRLDDGRTISSLQRRKIFAIVRDIAIWSGHEPEYIRKLMEWDYCSISDVEPFSLSDVDMSTARDFITYLIQFCFYHSVPTKDSLLAETDDIGKYLYLCLEYRRCAICNARADVHHVDHVGSGRNRQKIVHIGMRAVALCREHHTEAHRIGQKTFEEKYHVYGIKLDEYLCEKLRLAN